MEVVDSSSLYNNVIEYYVDNPSSSKYIRSAYFKKKNYWIKRRGLSKQEREKQIKAMTL